VRILLVKELRDILAPMLKKLLEFDKNEWTTNKPN
jgi:hypothetical protein